jgi:hypothetical protein
MNIADHVERGTAGWLASAEKSAIADYTAKNMIRPLP